MMNNKNDTTMWSIEIMVLRSDDREIALIPQSFSHQIEEMIAGHF